MASIAVIHPPQPDSKPPSASQLLPQEPPEVEELHTAPAIGEFHPETKRIDGWVFCYIALICTVAEPHPPEPKNILTEMNDIMVSIKKLSQGIV